MPTCYPTIGRAAVAIVGIAIAWCTVSCRTLSVADAATLRRPNMEFEDSGPFYYECGLLTQIETGTMASGGAAGGGCSSCH